MIMILDTQQCHGIQAILNQIQVQIQNSSNLKSDLYLGTRLQIV